MTQTPKPRVLLVLHEATRTGAPAVAVTLIDQLRDRVEFVKTTMIDGPLRERFVARMWSDHPPGTDFDAVWCNGAAATAVLEEIDDAIPAVAFVHEMGEALASLAPSAVDALRHRCDVVVTVSESARTGLVGMGVDSERIEIIEPPVAPRTRPSTEAVEHARAQCGAVEGAPLVLCCGEAAWRKGPDLFVHTAALISAEMQGAVRFAWVGRRSRSIANIVDHDAEVLGIADDIRWLGEVADASPYLAAADLVLLTSREDPHPLVPAEAALLGTATAAFDAGDWSATRAGDASGTFADSMAWVEYPDVAALAAAAVSLLRSAQARDRLAARAAQRVSTHQSPEVIAGRFGEILSRLCQRATTGASE